MLSANARPQVVVDYGPDPAESWVRRLVGDTLARVQGRMGTRAVLGADGAPESSLGGYGLSPQSFIGAGSRTTTNVTTRNGAFPEISSGIVEGPAGDTTRRIFAARMSRGRG